MIGIAAIAGFFLWNYPRGLIFLGDSGAYLIGFWIACASILLVVRHTSVSPWFALMVNAYPIFETLFTMWRRSVHQGKSMGRPDGAHFHSLIYRRVMRRTYESDGKAHVYLRNAKTSPVLWILSSLGVVPAVLWWNSSTILMVSAFFFIVLYGYFYRKIVRFRTPRWLGRSSSQASSINADTLEKLLLATDDSIRGIRDRALLLVAYDTLCRRSELVSLQVKDVKINIKNGIETSSILLRKSKTDQDSTGKWLHLSQRAHLALAEWIKKLPKEQEILFCGLNRALDISLQIGAGQINRIYKKIARKAGLDESAIEGISGHSMRVGAAQDLLNSGASMPIIMQRGRWSKTDTVMRYVEHSNC
jgi:integrase